MHHPQNLTEGKWMMVVYRNIVAFRIKSEELKQSGTYWHTPVLTDRKKCTLLYLEKYWCQKDLKICSIFRKCYMRINPLSQTLPRSFLWFRVLGFRREKHFSFFPTLSTLIKIFFCCSTTCDCGHFNTIESNVTRSPITIWEFRRCT